MFQSIIDYFYPSSSKEEEYIFDYREAALTKCSSCNEKIYFLHVDQKMISLYHHRLSVILNEQIYRCRYCVNISKTSCICSNTNFIVVQGKKIYGICRFCYIKKHIDWQIYNDHINNYKLIQKKFGDLPLEKILYYLVEHRDHWIIKNQPN